MKIVIISPTYNEKENIEKMIPTLFNEVFPKIKNHEVWLLIADDHSPDGTGDIVRDFMKKWRNIALLEGNKEGLGAAYVRAMQYAMEKMQADVVIEFDADFQHDPHDIPRLIAAMDEGADYVIGSRYIKGGAIPKEWGLDRKMKSIFGSLFARIVLFTFGIHDMTSGFKLTKTSFLRKVDLDHLISKNYAYKLQILYEVVRLGAKVREVPIVFYERTKGMSKMDTNDMIESFLLVLKLRIRDSQRVIKFLIVGGSGFIMQLIFQEFFARVVLVSLITESLRDGLSAGIGAEAAILSNFLFNNFWTFSDAKKLKESGNFFVKLIKFNVTSILSVLIQFVIVLIFVQLFGDTTHIFGFSLTTRIVILFPIIILLIIPLNYIIYNKIIWKTQHLSDGKTARA